MLDVFSDDSTQRPCINCVEDVDKEVEPSTTVAPRQSGFGAPIEATTVTHEERKCRATLQATSAAQNALETRSEAEAESGVELIPQW